MVVGSYPINDMFSLSAKAGGFWWEADAKATVFVDGEAIGSYSDDDGKVDLGYGLGARVDFNENLAARVEWEKYHNVGGDEHTGESDVDVISASVLFKF
jgi:opacity protein-like surface antigen